MSVPEGAMNVTKDESNQPDFGALDSAEAVDSAAPAATNNEQPAKPATDSAAADDDADLLAEDEPEAKPDETPKDASTEAKPGENNEGDAWAEIRKEFPTLTVAELRSLRDKAKNLEAGFTPKFQKVKEMAADLERRAAEMDARFGKLDTYQGEYALKIIQAVGDDPALQARLEKAFREVEVGPDDIANVHIAKMKRDQDRRFQDLEAKHRALEKVAIQLQVEEREAMARRVAEKHGLDWDDYDTLLGKEHAQLAAAGKLDAGFDWTAFFEIAAKKMEAKEDAKFKARLAKYKESKRTAAKVTPIGSRGGTAPVTKEVKEPETPDEQVSFLENLLGRRR